MTVEDPKIFYKKLYMKQWREKNKEHVKQYERQYRQTHKEQRREAVNRRNRLNPQKNRDHVNRYRLKYPEKVKGQRIREYLTHKERYAKYGRRYRFGPKREYILRQQSEIRDKRRRQRIPDPNKEYYIGALCWLDLRRRVTYNNARSELFNVLDHHGCQWCGFSDKRALQFDHINGGGTKESKTTFSHGRFQFYRFYVLNPEMARRTLQVLCANCNTIKRYLRNELR